MFWSLVATTVPLLVTGVLLFMFLEVVWFGLGFVGFLFGWVLFVFVLVFMLCKHSNYNKAQVLLIGKKQEKKKDTQKLFCFRKKIKKPSFSY